MGQTGVFQVLLVVGRDDDQISAFLFGLPQGFSCLDAVLFCLVILRQDDPVAILRVPAHGYRVTFETGIQHALDAGIVG